MHQKQIYTYRKFLIIWIFTPKIRFSASETSFKLFLMIWIFTPKIKAKWSIFIFIDLNFGAKNQILLAKPTLDIFDD